MSPKNAVHLQDRLVTREGRQEIIKELNVIKETRDLSLGEKTLLDYAQNWNTYIDRLKSIVLSSGMPVTPVHKNNVIPFRSKNAKV